ncbi:hypothetical protein A1OE_346 [Candidatus Endolissoclinum faulkneri L2]|uniref:DUF2232 domain-containing protein n=1 Tax=Candidatus Endolissoclinum faulkneri L2 TaxID=1193729 RepID=K7ZCG0_9PROT|nr:DUF2232 domain-containing protein [Candidatus Endolissoclinum faulkneri]AFX98541.1 hypothetical protein A1OE_346 [Candidatus Endolissoclinum faulkneri L2]
MNYDWLTVGIAATSSALMAVAVNPSPFFAVLQLSLTSLPIFLVGLTYGSFLGITTAVSAFVALVLSLGAESAVYHAILTGVPTALMIWQAERSSSHPMVLLFTLIAYACGMIALAAVYLSDNPQGMQGVIANELQQVYEKILLYANKAGKLPVTTNELHDMLSSLASLLPAFAAYGWVMATIVSAILAQFALRRFGKSSFSTPDIADLRSPRWITFVLLVVLAFAYLPYGVGFAAKNMVLVVLMIFLFTGLGVIHAFARSSTNGRFWLGSTYALLIIFNWVVAAMIVLIGALDVIFDFRRYTRSPTRE